MYKFMYFFIHFILLTWHIGHCQQYITYVVHVSICWRGSDWIYVSGSNGYSLLYTTYLYKKYKIIITNTYYYACWRGICQISMFITLVYRHTCNIYYNCIWIKGTYNRYILFIWGWNPYKKLFSIYVIFKLVKVM